MSAESARSTGRRDIHILCCVALHGAELQERFGAHREFSHQKAICSNNLIQHYSRYTYHSMIHC